MTSYDNIESYLRWLDATVKAESPIPIFADCVDCQESPQGLCDKHALELAEQATGGFSDY